MAATSTTTPVVAQTTMYNANPQDRPCLERFYQCSRCLFIISFFIVFVGVVNILMGYFTGGNLSDSFYDSFPEARRSGMRQMYAGIAVLVIGIIVLILSIASCCNAPRHSSNMPTTFSGTAMTTTVVAPNAASTPGLVQPPIIQRGGGGGGGQQTFVYSYQPQQQAGSFQPVQSSTN